MNVSTNLHTHSSLLLSPSQDYALHIYYPPLSISHGHGHTLPLSHSLSIIHKSVTRHQHIPFLVLHDRYNPPHSTRMSFSFFTLINSNTIHTRKFKSIHTPSVIISILILHPTHTPISHTFPFIRLSFSLDSSFYIHSYHSIPMSDSSFILHVTIEQENERSFSLRTSSVPLFPPILSSHIGYDGG